jgi:hypothetical protein
MDANGLMSGDRGYDPSTEQGSQAQPETDPNPFLGKLGKAKKPTDEELWLKDHPAQPMAPIDYSAAPAWWNNGKGGGEVAPAAPQLPTTPAQSAGRMIDYLGNVGGQTGVVATSPLSAALRGVTAASTGGQSNG